MKVTFKLFAGLQDYLPAEAKNTNAVSLDVDEATTVEQVIDRFSLPRKSVHLVLINGIFVPPQERVSRKLREGEALAIWPPVAGG